MILAAGALFSLRPWEADSVDPHLTVLPDLGVGPGRSVEVAPEPLVAGATVAAAPPARLVVEPATVVAKRGPVLTVGVSQGVAVARSQPVAAPVQPPKPQPAPVAVPVATAPEPAPAATPVTTPVQAPLLVADFENGLQGWSTAAMDDAAPTVVDGDARDGETASVFRLSGDQSSSQLIFGGEGGGTGAVQIHEGDEYAFAFSLYIETMAYGEPGADNLVMRLASEASDSRVFGLELWGLDGTDPEDSSRGLWSSGDAVGGDRFLAPVSEGAWHDLVVHFKASGQDEGFYEVYLDGQLVDARNEVSTIAPGSGYAQIEVGLMRDGERVQGTSEIRLDAAKLGPTLESILP